jgi:hypothetical protein
MDTRDPSGSRDHSRVKEHVPQRAILGKSMFGRSVWAFGMLKLLNLWRPPGYDLSQEPKPIFCEKFSNIFFGEIQGQPNLTLFTFESISTD